MLALPGLLARFKNPRPQPQKIGDVELAALPLITAPIEEDEGLLSAALRASEMPIANPATETVAAPDKESDAAIAQWREALQTRPNFARGHLRLGLALYESGEIAEAVAELQKAARLGRDAGLSSADCGLACCGLGCALLAQGSNHEVAALSAFGKAVGFLASTLDFAPPSLTQGIALYEQGQYEAAIAALRETLCLGPETSLFGTDPALAHCALGSALIAQSADNRDAAFQEFRHAFGLLRQIPGRM